MTKNVTSQLNIVELALNSVPAKTQKSVHHFDLLSMEEWEQINVFYIKGNSSLKSIYNSMKSTFESAERGFYKDYANFYSTFRRIFPKKTNID